MPDREERGGVTFTHLDQPLFDGAGATKRELVDYLEALGDRLVEQLRDRPLTVVRVRPGEAPFVQKNLPGYAPGWVKTVRMWAESSRREIAAPLCDDQRTLLWFGNQRAVEYHPMLVRVGDWHHPTHLVLDLDPPERPDGTGFALAVRTAGLVREALDQAGLTGAVKTSGAKGLHVLIPVADADAEEAAAVTRALAARAERLDQRLATTAFIKADRAGKVFIDSTRAGGATVAAAFSPRARPGVPVSFPVSWADLDRVRPGDLTIRTAPGLIARSDPWASEMPGPQRLDQDLIEEGRKIPIARVLAMHEGKRRAKARREATP